MIAEPIRPLSAVARPQPSLALRIAQVVWVILVLVNVGRFVLSMFVYYDTIEQLCTNTVVICHGQAQLMEQDVASLQADHISPHQWAVYNILYRILAAAVFWSVGLLIFVRKRDEWAALLISLFLMLVGAIGGFSGLLSAQYPDYILLLNLTQYPAWVAFALFFFTFPNGRVVPRIMWLVIVIWSLYFFINILFPVVDKESGFFLALQTVAWTGMFVGGAAAQIYRYVKISNEAERRQIKWVVSGIAAMVVFVLLFVFFPPFSQFTGDRVVYSLPGLLTNIASSFALMLIPITVGIAIFRYRLFEIDVIIRRTLVYGVLTAMLALFYFGSVVVLQQLFRGLTGQGSDLAIIISTLAIAALSGPLRNRVQRAIDHRFFRRKYNAGQVLATFAATVRDEVDLGRLTDELQSVVEETMQPEHVSLWLAGGGRRTKDEGRRTKVI